MKKRFVSADADAVANTAVGEFDFGAEKVLLNRFERQPAPTHPDQEDNV